jgi:alcohol dehydrogenase YqhD (iron-dependent ADH family)
VTDYSYAVNVWNIDPSGKTDTEIAEAGLVEMRKWMQEMHLVLSLKELGVTEVCLKASRRRPLFSTADTRF